MIIHCTVGYTADAENILSAKNPELSKVLSGFMQNKQNYIKTDSNLREETFHESRFFSSDDLTIYPTASDSHQLLVYQR